MLKNMKIGKRLIASFIVAIIISSVAGAIGVTLLNKIDSDYGKVLENYGFAQGELGNLGRHFQASRAVNMDIVTAATPADRAKFMEELAVEDAGILEHMEEVKARLGSELGQQIYKELDDAMNVFFAARELAFKTTQNSKDINQAVATYQSSIDAPSDVVRGLIDTMVEDKTRIGNEMSAGLTTQTIIFTWVMVAIMIAAFVVAVILAIIISKGISKPIVEIKEAAVKISNGNYDVEIIHQSRDEIGALADSMRTMTTTTNGIILDSVRGLGEIADGNFNITAGTEYIGVFEGIQNAIKRIITDLSNTMAQIKSTSDQVASGSDQVSSGAQALAQGATEQASSVQELSASVNEVSEHIKNNAGNAQTASKLAVTVGEQIATSNQQMNQMMSAMTEISESSSHISRIIKTIEDIAFQTNILALNAAVEAARAGAAGKGFAVVADEVRNLATKSSEAAKQTNGLIEGSVRSVENGVKIAGETAKSLNDVVAGAKDIIDMINNITSASSEQATAIAQINQGVEQISSVVQTNSATSEESAAASEQLSGQANIMRELVSKFKLLGGIDQQIDLMDEQIKYQPANDDNRYAGSKY